MDVERVNVAGGAKMLSDCAGRTPVGSGGNFPSEALMQTCRAGKIEVLPAKAVPSIVACPNPLQSYFRLPQLKKEREDASELIPRKKKTPSFQFRPSPRNKEAEEKEKEKEKGKKPETVSDEARLDDPHTATKAVMTTEIRKTSPIVSPAVEPNVRSNQPASEESKVAAIVQAPPEPVPEKPVSIPAADPAKPQPAAEDKPVSPAKKKSSPMSRLTGLMSSASASATLSAGRAGEGAKRKAATEGASGKRKSNGVAAAPTSQEVSIPGPEEVQGIIARLGKELESAVATLQVSKGMLEALNKVSGARKSGEKLGASPICKSSREGSGVTLYSILEGLLTPPVSQVLFSVAGVEEGKASYAVSIQSSTLSISFERFPG